MIAVSSDLLRSHQGLATAQECCLKAEGLHTLLSFHHTPMWAPIFYSLLSLGASEQEKTKVSFFSNMHTFV